MRKTLLIIFAALFTASASAQLPGPAGYVNDFAGVLGDYSYTIEDNIRLIEEQTGVEVAVVTIAELPEGYDIFTYGVELFENWGIGKQGEDNGVLVLLSVKERKWRIEIGYGLEPVLTDAEAGRIGRETLEKAFETGEYGAEANNAVYLIGEEILQAQESGDYINGFIRGIDWYVVAIAVIIIIIAVVILVLTGNGWVVWMVARLLLAFVSRGRFGGGKSGGGGAGNQL